MKAILGEDIHCPFCGYIFFEGSEVEVTNNTIRCPGCGAILDVEIKDGQVFM